MKLFTAVPQLQPANRSVICYVTDSRALGDVNPNAVRSTLLNIVREAAAAGADWVQIREKHLLAREMTSFAREAVSATGAARIIVNDRLDVAIAVGAGGVHLGSESMPVENVAEWRRTVGPAAGIGAGFLIGKSCHSMDEVCQAEIAGADYVFFGPVFPTPSKEQYGPSQGLEKLAEVCAATQLPVLAIGGITAENAAECIRAGASGIAAIRLFQQAADIRKLMQRLRLRE